METSLLPSSNAIEVALFPIPDVVAFPGTIVPLHVFEPRYRRLIHDCVRDERMVGVSHVRKTIHEPARRQTLEQKLSSNQATYQPREVFCAGHCEIVETTPDGRIIVTITMSHRLRLVDELQTLPYRIVSCTPIQDDELPGAPAQRSDLQRLINNRLIAMVGEQNPDMARELGGAEWASLEPHDYSFKIFQILRFDAEVMQTILEARSANARLELIWDQLRRA
jgi:Lon protease-like protein